MSTTQTMLAHNWKPAMPPEDSPPGLSWWSLPEGRLAYRGELNGRRRLIVGDSFAELLALAQRMFRGEC